MTQDQLKKNLIDAGCPAEMIHEILESFSSRDQLKGFREIEKYRKELLKSIHLQQMQLDRLDYLVYQMKRN